MSESAQDLWQDEDKWPACNLRTPRLLAAKQTELEMFVCLNWWKGEYDRLERWSD